MYILFLFEIFICRITCCILLENYNKIFSFILISGTFFLFICFGQFTKPIRDRPFNLKGGGGGLWFFVSFRIFFVVQSANFFFQNLTLDYMTKTLNQNIFLEKNHNPPPPPFKLNGRSLTYFLLKIFIWCTYLSVEFLWC